MHTSTPTRETINLPLYSTTHHTTNMRSFGTEISGNRRSNTELSKEARSSILAQVDAGAQKVQVARDFGVSRRVIYNTINRFTNHQSLASLPRKGRPPKLDRHAKRRLLRIIRKQPKIEYATLLLEAEGISVAKRTLSRLFKLHGISNWISKRRPRLSKTASKERLKFARLHRNRDWKTTMFSDETSVERGSGNNAVWVFRKPSQKWDLPMIDTQSIHKGLSQMFWGCFWWNGRSKLIDMRRDHQANKRGYSALSYLSTLEDGFIDIYQPGYTFMQDNAPIHKALVTQEWLESHGVEVMDWPPYSPDLNPIEHLWWALKRMVYHLHPELEKEGGSKAAIERFIVACQEAWDKLPQSLLNDMLESMPRRVEAVRKARGWQTKY